MIVDFRGGDVVGRYEIPRGVRGCGLTVDVVDINCFRVGLLWEEESNMQVIAVLDEFHLTAMSKIP